MTFRGMLLAGAGLLACSTAQAQEREFRQLDENGVDLVHGDFVMSFKEGSIGSGEAELALIRRSGSNRSTEWDSSLLSMSVINTSGSMQYQVRLGSGVLTDIFVGPTSHSFTSTKADGATLTRSGNTFLHRSADGTIATYGYPPEADANGGTSNFCGSQLDGGTECQLPLLSIVRANGHATYLDWDVHTMSNGVSPPLDAPAQGPTEPEQAPSGTSASESPQPASANMAPPQITYVIRLRRVSNSFGYAIQFAYQAVATSPTAPPPAAWRNRLSAQFSLNGIGQGTIGYAYPAADTVDVTDTANRVWRVTRSSIQRPGESSPSMMVNYPATDRISVLKDGVTTNYHRVVNGTTATMTKTNALSEQTVVISDVTRGRPTSIRDALGKTTTYSYDASRRVTRVTAPDLNYVEHVLDERGNATQTVYGARPGSGATNITTSAVYPDVCTNVVTCNKPTSVTDGRQNATSYTYDETHGGVLTVTAPAPAAGQAAPQVRYGYTQVAGVHQVTSVSMCRTQASCAGSADETRQTLGYSAQGNLTSQTVAAGDGSLSATTTATYTPRGDLLSVDGPLAGAVDMVTYRHDAARQLVGVISPDPDGGGPLPRQAQRITYDPAGRQKDVEAGTVTGTDDAAWAGFVSLQQQASTFDANGRVVRQTLSGGGQMHQLVQYGHDALGRVACAAVRMNPAAWGGLPADACALGAEGIYGPDRITQAFYDPVGRVERTRSGVGTAVAADDARVTYTANGQVATATDANNNRTTYEYDGHDRLRVTRYPVHAVGSQASSQSDYEELGYDAAGNVTSRRKRDGRMFGFQYDALNRLVVKIVPDACVGGGHVCTQPPPSATRDVYYGYNLLGQETYARFDHHFASDGVFSAYDALGRMISSTTAMGGVSRTLTYGYAANGVRTRITHPDGPFFTYEYDGLDRLTGVRENGGNYMAGFSYNAQGRRANRSVYGNADYSYDAAGRLSGLVIGLPWENPVTYGYSYNPAGQITQATRSRDDMAFTRHVNVDRSYVTNGLNQYSFAGPAAFHFDASGNLITDGRSTYTYDAENRLLTARGATFADLTYDAWGRLHQVSGSTGVRQFLYDGSALVSEHGTGTGRRYVHGTGADEPLVWYDTDGVRFLFADHQGSVVWLSGQFGAPYARNAYDEYGIPRGGNTGRFQYTGQAWIPELGMHYYKARMYSPTMGRFLQTDPIGYADGMNWYDYVGGDPVNRTDPTGMCRTVNVGYSWYTTDGEYLGPAPGNFFVEQGCYDYGSGGSRSGGGGIGNRYQGFAQDNEGGGSVGEESPQNVLENRGKGERGWAGKNPNPEGKPNKGLKPVFGRPGWVQPVDPQTGRNKGNPRPAREGEPGYVGPSVTERVIAPPAPIPLPSPRCLRLRHPVLVGGCMIFTS